MALAAVIAACGSPRAKDKGPVGPWSRGFEPPAPPTSARFVLEPAVPAHAEREHAALLASADHLRTTVFDAWPPPDFSLEQNRRELVRHADEFQRRAAYAYTVLSPDGSTSLGGVFLRPARPAAGAGPAVELTYWVAAREIPRGLDEHLLDTVVGWLDREWPFVEVILPMRVENRRAASLARGARMGERPSPASGWRLFVHRR